MAVLLRWAGVAVLLCGVAFAETGDPLARLADPAAWKPMGATPPALREGGGLSMRCNFSATDDARASWDATVDLDLSASLGFAFDLRCDDPSPVSYFNVYLHTGAGWYSMTFSPGSVGGPSRIQVLRTDMKTEGAPGGWRHIDKVRISAWRGTASDTSFHLANFSLLAATPGVAILQAQRSIGGAAGESRTVVDAARRVARYLNALGVPYTPLSDVDLQGGVPAGQRVVIVPYCPSLDTATQDALCRFVDRGGKLLTFYSVPERIARAVGLIPGRHIDSGPGERFSSMRADEGAGVNGLPEVVRQRSWNIITALPDAHNARAVAWWHDAAGARTEAAVFLSDTGAHVTHILLEDDHDAQATLLLSLVGALYPEAWAAAANHATGALLALAKQLDAGPVDTAAVEAHVKGGDFPGALRAAATERDRTLDAYYRRQRAVPGEFRGFWCHSPFGIPGMTWDEAVRTLADNGFTALFVNMSRGATAWYPSDVLPVSPDVADRGDQLAACLAACRKYAVECHVWRVCWNMGNYPPKAFRDQLKRDGRTQVLEDGTAKDDWLCPCHPDNRALEIAAMAEVADRYPVDGLHFDYIRFPNSSASYSDACRRAFEARTGRNVNPWPAALTKAGGLRDAWLDFRREQITAVVQGVHDTVRPRHPGVKLSAAVFNTWPTNRDTIGQDWKAWCDAGWLDFVCPMDYTDSAVTFDGWVARQLEWAGGVPVYPGIGLSLWDSSDPMLRLIEQVEITRRRETGGFLVFNYGASEARETVPKCGLGLLQD